MNKLNLLISAGAALLAVIVGHLYLKRLEAEVSGGPKVPVLVVTGDIPVGGKLTEELIAVREVPQSYVEERHVRQSDARKVIGSRISGGLKANESILWSDLSKYSERTRALSGLVQAGMRAVSIDARSSSFDGLLRPGDRVDVLFSSTGDGATKTFLQNVLVLSVGGSIARVDDPESGERGRASGTTVTLSVTVEQAQLLTHALSRGRLTLTLRNIDDIALVDGLSETTGALKQETAAAHSFSKGTIEHVR